MRAKMFSTFSTVLLLAVLLQLQHEVLGYSYSDQYFSGEGKKFGVQEVAFAVSGPKGHDYSPYIYNSESGTVMEYFREELNIGGGFDMNTGKFTAPVEGIYYFTWHGNNFNYSTQVPLHIMISHEGYPDDQLQGTGMTIYATAPLEGTIATVSTKGYMYLKTGETVSSIVYGQIVHSSETPDGFKDFPEYIGFSGYLVRTVEDDTYKY